MNAIKLILVALLFSVSGCAGCDRGYSDGERVGVVTKFSHKGYVYKSWEGQMNLGGMTTDANGNTVPNIWEFTVTDEALVPKVQEALASGRHVALHYQQWAIKPTWIDSNYEIDGVK